MSTSGTESRFDIFALCPPGLEDLLSRELKSLGINGKKTRGGVEFHGDLSVLYSVNLWSRIAGRILVRIGNFRLLSLKKAEERFSRYPWELYLPKEREIRIRAAAHRSRIYHSGALAQRLVQGISKRLGRRIRQVSEKSGEDKPLVFVRMFKDRCQISMDSSGRHLHKRGLKKHTVRAPFRENLAAAMLLASGWDRHSNLLDPFCGSGTIVMEAVLMASMIPPGRRRTFSFMKWKNFQPETWHQLLSLADKLRTRPLGKILGIDRDRAAAETALFNLEQSGLISSAEILHADFFDLQKAVMAEPGFIVTNPPYGRRLRENYSLSRLYALFGENIKRYYPRWHITMVCPADGSYLKRALGLALKPFCRFRNGGIRVELLSSPVL